MPISILMKWGHLIMELHFSVIFLRNHTFAFVFALLLSLILFLYWYSLHIMGYQLHAAGFQLLCCFEGLYFSSYIHLQPWLAARSPLWVTWDESKEFRNLPCLVSYTCCARFSLPTVQMKRKHQSNRVYKTIYKVKRLLSAQMLSMFAVYCKISSKRLIKPVIGVVKALLFFFFFL